MVIANSILLFYLFWNFCTDFQFTSFRSSRCSSYHSLVLMKPSNANSCWNSCLHVLRSFSKLSSVFSPYMEAKFIILFTAATELQCPPSEHTFDCLSCYLFETFYTFIFNVLLKNNVVLSSLLFFCWSSRLFNIVRG